MTTRKGKVYVFENFAGILEESNAGKFIFTYDENYLKNFTHPVSLTLPLQSTPYESSVLFPFFDGLIPEGWLLNISIKNWKLNPYDRMGLLLLTCQDCIGSVKVVNYE